jgi:hypothetical protein
MTSSSKEVRRDIMDSGCTYIHHSLNQKTMLRVKEGEKHFYGNSGKASKAEQRRLREAQFIEEFPEKQFARSLRNAFSGSATSEELAYLSRHLSSF